MIHRFDDFELDTDRFELRHAGQVRHVEPRVFDLIHYLSARAGQVVDRDTIIEGVWGGRIVSDATISSAIKSARQALGDNGGSQNYIETVRGRGFRFNAALAPVAASGETEGTEPPGSATNGANASPSVVAPETRKPVVAVMPFDNLSSHVDDYFAEGLTEDIITNLSRFRELLVVARSSTFQFASSDRSLAAFCEELGAGYAVQGSVRRAGERVRISAQLIDAGSGVHLWADRYDREMRDILEVQEEVTRTIAATLGVKMQDVALQQPLRKSPEALDAYDCVLRARRYTWQLSPELHAEARDLLERAVKLDPANADAFALLANVYLAEHRFEANPRPDPIGRALKMAETAVRLDPQNGYARCWLAIVHFFRRENDKFEAEAQRALDLNPNDPEILADIGHYLTFMGAFERGADLSRQAQKLNPLHPGWYHFCAARLHFNERDYAAVLSDIERIGMTEFYWTHMLRAAALGQLGDLRAPASLARVFELNPDFDVRGELEKWNTAPDDLQHMLEGLKKAGLV